MVYLYILTGVLLLVSLIKDRKKTARALKIATKKIYHILPAFLSMLVLVSIILFLVPNSLISYYLGGSGKLVGVIIASVFGSITLMPGFISFPLCGILLQKGVSYTVLSAFSTTLMMVGVITFPVEKAYFGVKVTILRNVMSYFIALVIALVTGIYFGEIM
ncbi:permease [bacterium]|nr:permease [bacterium]